jgi:hypothetical protein
MSSNEIGYISERAYAIWENEGRPDGKALNHWLQAERELELATKASDIRVAQPAKLRKPKGRRDRQSTAN